jgi:CelD/BcsL family acetyltransferase involved in cellulose biosynthesis
VQVRIARPSELGPEERARWAALQQTRADTIDPFFSLGWALLIDAVRADARVAVIEDGGAVRAFLPLQRQSGFSALPMGAPLADYFGLIGDPGPDFDLRCVARALKVDRIDFALAPASQTAFARFACGMESSTGAAFEGSDALKKVSQKRRKLERERGPALTRHGVREAGALDALIGWKTEQLARTRQPNLFERPWVMDVLRRAQALETPEFGLDLTMLELEGRPIAAVANLTAANAQHAWWIAHDPDPALQAYSPGTLVWRDMLEHAARGGAVQVDFGQGDYQYKRSFATYARPTLLGVAARPTPAGLVRKAEFAARNLIERLPWPAVAALPGKAMRRIDYNRSLAAG